MAGINFTNINQSFTEASAPLPPPPYEAHYPPLKSNEEILSEIINRYEISSFFAGKLQKLKSFKIVFIFDDSGSMNMILEESPLNTSTNKVTRWDELKYFARIGLEIASGFNPDGTDVYFLNRPTAYGVRSSDQLVAHFLQPPNGYTPMCRALNTVLKDNESLRERKLLVVIVTDGQPTDEQGRSDIKGLRDMLKYAPKHVHTTIVSCTDEEATMDYLNNWDKKIER